MTIHNSTPNDLSEIFRLYQLATDYQRTKEKCVVWPQFEQSMVAAEIEANMQWKMVIEGQIACVWATTFSDPLIWKEKKEDAAVYIHRIATNPDFKGRQFVSNIVQWATDFARQHEKTFIRLDTVGENIGLINHYTASGFQFLGLFQLTDTEQLPAHYHQAKVSLFEIKVKT